MATEDFTRLVEEVPGVPVNESYYLWHQRKVVWKGRSKGEGEAWALEQGIVIEEFEPFES